MEEGCYSVVGQARNILKMPSRYICLLSQTSGATPCSKRSTEKAAYFQPILCILHQITFANIKLFIEEIYAFKLQRWLCLCTYYALAFMCL